jgi:hypothetical protein
MPKPDCAYMETSVLLTLPHHLGEMPISLASIARVVAVAILEEQSFGSLLAAERGLPIASASFFLTHNPRNGSLKP